MKNSTAGKPDNASIGIVTEYLVAIAPNGQKIRITATEFDENSNPIDWIVYSKIGSGLNICLNKRQKKFEIEMHPLTKYRFKTARAADKFLRKYFAEDLRFMNNSNQ